ncbi:hypothetical protein [Encephalitozoon cuniculi GB-M1]|uniref:Uncharacterized protein n=1 Tax=Encephalitozoon cuniculi (strain GB-M1) TaxID=284813 RepID=Q8SVZ9_ENCCU|nr:uncharacterized protein ECU03_1480 [Encephalitozoon cuniculi GB-M1]CAD26291.1 hypothetical protein [Encephalitozoon cuniculi GB-M1]
MEDQCHIFPFFAPETSEVNVEYLDLSKDAATIRGIACVKKTLSPSANVFLGDEVVKGPLFYWEPAGLGSAFERGLKLVGTGLGFTGRGEAREPAGETIARKKHRKNKH